ncbi:MAG: galactokinase family protein, partial [Planctomycetota bacterium]
MTLLDLDPIPTLLDRLRDEYGSTFAGKTVRVSRAPGRLDVMGGIADYTGSLVCEMPLAQATAVAVSRREDRKIVAYSLNLADANRPFRLELPLDVLANMDADTLSRELAQPGREWAGYVVGCLFLLGEKQLVNWSAVPGMDIALYSTVPSGGGVSSSASVEVATMMNLAHELDVAPLKTDGMRLAVLCQEVENRIVGAPCGVMDQVA